MFLSPFKSSTPKTNALVFSPKGAIVEQKKEQLFQEKLFNNNQFNEYNIENIKKGLKKAAKDKKITLLILKLDGLESTGLSILNELGESLKTFKKSGKKIYAILNNATTNRYFLASYADEIIMHPLGSFMPTGISVNRLYYKDLLDKLGVNTHVFKVGTFKSAIEPYLYNKMSPAARKANYFVFNDLWQSQKAIIAQNRTLKSQKLQHYIDSLDKIAIQQKGTLIESSVKWKFIDTLLFNHEIKDLFIKKVGKNKKTNSFNQINFVSYYKNARTAPKASVNSIAIIVAKGQIVNGYQKPGTVGGLSTATLIKKARTNKSTKAIVLRIDSPGGAVFASENIRQELLLAKKSGLPIIASMGNVAASGGYWIATPADEIIANPHTITGSIGVFGLIPTFEKTLQKGGIYSDGIGTTRLSNGINPTKGLSPKASIIIQQEINQIYKTFLTIVSESRNMPIKQVDKIAQGRIWTGKQALKLKLVDHLGSIDLAIKHAAKRAQLDDYSLKYYQQKPSFTQKLFNQASYEILQKSNLNLYPLKPFKHVFSSPVFNQNKSIQVICLECPSY